MNILDDRSTVSIHRDGVAYVVEHRSADGRLLDQLFCGDDYEEAVACFETHPSFW